MARILHLLLLALFTATALSGCSPSQQRRDKPLYQDIASPESGERQGG